MAQPITVTKPVSAQSHKGAAGTNGITAALTGLCVSALAAWHPFFDLGQNAAWTAVVLMGVLNMVFSVLRTFAAKRGYTLAGLLVLALALGGCASVQSALDRVGVQVSGTFGESGVSLDVQGGKIGVAAQGEVNFSRLAIGAGCFAVGLVPLDFLEPVKAACRILSVQAAAEDADPAS